MIGIPESELSRAQADVEPRLSARVYICINYEIRLFYLE